MLKPTMSAEYALRMEVLRSKREELTARRHAIEKKLALREATAAEFTAVALQSQKQKWKRLRSAAVAAKARDDEFICSLRDTQQKANDAYLKQKNVLTASSAALEQEKRRLQQLKALEEKKRAVEKRRYLSGRYRGVESLNGFVALRFNHEIELSENLERNEAHERELLGKQSAVQANRLDHTIREHAIGARSYMAQQAHEQIREATEIGDEVADKLFETFSPRSALNALKQANSSLSFSEHQVQLQNAPPQRSVNVQIPHTAPPHAQAPIHSNQMHQQDEKARSTRIREVQGALPHSSASMQKPQTSSSQIYAQMHHQDEKVALTQDRGRMPAPGVERFSAQQAPLSISPVNEGADQSRQTGFVDHDYPHTFKQQEAFSKDSPTHDSINSNQHSDLQGSPAITFQDRSSPKISASVQQNTIEVAAASLLPTSAIHHAGFSIATKLVNAPAIHPKAISPSNPSRISTRALAFGKRVEMVDDDREYVTIEPHSEAKSTATSLLAPLAEEKPSTPLPKQKSDSPLQRGILYESPPFSDTKSEQILQKESTKEETKDDEEKIPSSPLEGRADLHEQGWIDERFFWGLSDSMTSDGMLSSLRADSVAFCSVDNGEKGIDLTLNIVNSFDSSGSNTMINSTSQSHKQAESETTETPLPLSTKNESSSETWINPVESMDESNSFASPNFLSSSITDLNSSPVRTDNDSTSNLPFPLSVKGKRDEHPAMKNSDGVSNALSADFASKKLSTECEISQEMSPELKVSAQELGTRNIGVENSELDLSLDESKSTLLGSVSGGALSEPPRLTESAPKPADVEEKIVEEKKVSPIEKLSMADKVKALGALISRVEEGAADGDRFNTDVGNSSAADTRRELVRMAAGGRKAQMSYFNSDVCFGLILDFAQELGPAFSPLAVLFPPRAFEGIMSEQKIKKVHQNSKDKELELWKLLSNHIKQMATLKALSASALGDAFGAAFLRHDPANQGSQRKVILYYLCWKLMRGGKMGDYSEFEDEDEVDLQNLIGSKSSMATGSGSSALNSSPSSASAASASSRVRVKEDNDFDVDF
ncbi:hypothetical protein FI667_g12335, partial [Globisporangium splendens]